MTRAGAGAGAAVLAALGAVLAVLVPAAACGRSGGGRSSQGDGVRLVDNKEVESVLVATQRRSSGDLPVGPASCPSGVVATEGATLECTVLVDGVAAPYVVTVHDVEAARGLRYEVRPAKAILLLSKVVDAIKRSVPFPTATVDCGRERVRVVDVGGTFDCTLARPEGTRTVRVLVETVDGSVSFRET